MTLATADSITFSRRRTKQSACYGCSMPRVCSNTGTVVAKSTPRAAVAKFAAGGNPAQRKIWV